MCHFEYTNHRCGHASDQVASICNHMALVVNPKVCFATMPFAKMSSWVKVCTRYWGERDTRVHEDSESDCDECALKDTETSESTA